MIGRSYRCPGLACFLMRFRGRPIGYLQCYDPAKDSFRTLLLDRRATRGIDLFIGEPAALGRGHGAAFLRLMADYAMARPNVKRVIGDPEPENLASRRAFDRAGFIDFGEIRFPWGPARLMVRQQPAGRTGLAPKRARFRSQV